MKTEHESTCAEHCVRGTSSKTCLPRFSSQTFLLKSNNDNWTTVPEFSPGQVRSVRKKERICAPTSPRSLLPPVVPGLSCNRLSRCLFGKYEKKMLKGFPCLPGIFGVFFFSFFANLPAPLPGPTTSSHPTVWSTDLCNWRSGTCHPSVKVKSKSAKPSHPQETQLNFGKTMLYLWVYEGYPICVSSQGSYFLWISFIQGSSVPNLKIEASFLCAQLWGVFLFLTRHLFLRIMCITFTRPSSPPLNRIWELSSANATALISSSCESIWNRLPAGLLWRDQISAEGGTDATCHNFANPWGWEKAQAIEGSK